MPAINIFFALNLFTCVQSYFINGDDIISASFEITIITNSTFTVKSQKNDKKSTVGVSAAIVLLVAGMIAFPR